MGNFNPQIYGNPGSQSYRVPPQKTAPKPADPKVEEARKDTEASPTKAAANPPAAAPQVPEAKVQNPVVPMPAAEMPKDQFWAGIQGVGGNSRTWNVGGSAEAGYCFRVAGIHCAELGVGYQYTIGMGLDRQLKAYPTDEFQLADFDRVHGPYALFGYKLGLHPAFQLGILAQAGIAFLKETLTEVDLKPGISLTVRDTEYTKAGFTGQLGVQALARIWGPIWAHGGVGVKTVPALREDEGRHFGLGLQLGARWMF